MLALATAAAAAAAVTAMIAPLDERSPHLKLQRNLQEEEPCATVDPTSTAWHQDPNAAAEYARQTAGNPDAEPFHECYQLKCFSYKVNIKKWKQFQLIEFTWHDKIQIDAIYGADISENSPSAMHQKSSHGFKLAEFSFSCDR